MRKKSNFFSIHTGEANSYYPRERRAEYEKREFTPNELDTGFQILWAFNLDHLQPVELILCEKNPTFLAFILGRTILIAPERGGLNMRRGNSTKMG